MEPDVRAEVEKIPAAKRSRTSRATFSTPLIPIRSNPLAGRPPSRSKNSLRPPSLPSLPIPISETRSSRSNAPPIKPSTPSLKTNCFSPAPTRKQARPRATPSALPRLYRARQSRDRSAPDSLQSTVQEAPDGRTTPRTRIQVKTRVRSSPVPKIWHAFEIGGTRSPSALLKNKSQTRRFTDLVSLVRTAIEPTIPLEPFEEHVRQRFDQWLREKDASVSQPSNLSSQPAHPGALS